MSSSRLLCSSGAACVGRIVALAIGAVLALIVVGMAESFATGGGTSHADAPDFAAIDHYVQEQMQEMRMPGMALGIVKRDEVAHLEGFGDADSSSGRAVTPQTPFIIGSTSKSFTALAIMQLVEAGKVKLDAPVRRYIPWFRVADEEASKRITVRNLLNHTSGLSRAAATEALLQKDSNKGALQRAVRSLRTEELDRPVGKSFEYSNVNYTILGLIVQIVSGESYERYLEEHILNPLKMDDSYMFVSAAQRHGLATGHQYWFGVPFPGGGTPATRAMHPSGYISSTAKDMSHYLITQLNGGRYKGAQILSAEGIARMHQGTARMGPHIYYAMGWEEWEDSEIGGVHLVRHNGDTGNFEAHMLLAPESGWGVVVLMNGSNHLRLGGPAVIANGVMARLLGVEPPPEPFNEAMALFFIVLAVGALQVLGIVRTVVLVRRWRRHPELRPHGALRVSLRVVLPIVPNLLWALICLVLLPWVSQTPPSVMVLSDSGLVQVLSGAVALVWGVVLRPVVVLLALRTKRATPGDAGAQQEGGVQTQA